jgi:TetR/AcrR family transcriptional regulator, repressor of fatR-cypB operon
MLPMLPMLPFFFSNQLVYNGFGGVDMARERKFSTDELFQATKLLLLKQGYEGFTFSLLADYLHVSRGAIYKYYENKEELISEFMLYEMNHFLEDIKGIEQIDSFQDQLDFLIRIMFKNEKIQPLIEMGKEIPINTNQKARENKVKLDLLHLHMYHFLQEFVYKGKDEKILKASIPDTLILGYIFQSVSIPNHFDIPHQEWVDSIKEMICHGILKR